MVAATTPPPTFGRSALALLVGLASLATLAWFLLREGPREPSAGARVPTSPIEETARVEPSDLVEPASASERKVAEAPAPAPEAPLAHREPAPVANAFLTIRVLRSDGGAAEGVGVEWVTRTVQGETVELMIDGESGEHGRIAIEEEPMWWSGLFGGDEGTRGFGAFFQAVGLRSTLPFEEYQPTDVDEAPGVLRLESEPPRDEPLDLVLPPSGFVRFEWEPPLDGRGRALERFFLHIRRSDGRHFPGWRTGFHVPEGATNHLFGPVGLGWEVYASLSSSGVVGEVGRVRAPGPTVEGETVRVPIEVHATHRTLVRLAGVATDESDAPLADGYLRVVLGAPDARSVQVATDPEGAWSLRLPREELPPEVQVQDRSSDPRIRGRAVLEAADDTRTIFDVGRVALLPVEPEGPPPVSLVSGRVVDSSGAPLHRANVQVEGRARSHDGTETDPAAWTQLARTTTDSDGRYATQAVVDLAETNVRVWIRETDHLRIPAFEVPAGSAGVDVTLTRGAAVRLEVDVEPWLAITETVALRFRGHGRNHNPSLMDFHGHYGGTFSGLELGTYVLQVELGDGDAILHEQEVEVSGDVDLGTIDLRGQVLQCVVRLLDAGGAPLEKGYVTITDEATGLTLDRSARVDDRGRAWLVVPASSDGVWISCGVGRARVDASHFFAPGGGDPPEPAVIHLVP